MMAPRFVRFWAVALSAAAAAAAAVLWLNLRGDPAAGADVDLHDPARIARGAYLARVGNCMVCHTERGGAPYAGGRGIETPFGTVYSSNLTPDAQTGLGRWTADDFWRALRNGRSRDGRLLYPAFPYPNYTQMRREDADAIFAFLRSQPAVPKAHRPVDLRWPYNTQAALAIWRALYFSPGGFEPQAAASETWNRGAYLVQSLGHCSACHAPRNALGASKPLDLAGGLIPMQNWYAPSLTDPAQAAVTDWSLSDIVALLQTGVSARGSAQGPMAQVVLHSTQYMNAEDLQAIAVFLKALPPSVHKPVDPRPAARASAEGSALYEKHCAQCHGEQGQGRAPAYPPLAGNRAVTMEPPVNLVQMVLHGGYPPATAGHPRPYGMPPFWMHLSENELSQLLNHLRSSWGHQASEVTALQVQKARSKP